jgi:hypothetical protein
VISCFGKLFMADAAAMTRPDAVRAACRRDFEDAGLGSGRRGRTRCRSGKWNSPRR